MINTSNEYKQYIRYGRTFLGGAEITLADNTDLNLDNAKIISIKIDDATSQSGRFTIGAVIINTLTLRINNLYDEFSDYDFTDAVIYPTVGLQLSETVESLHKGVFTVDDAIQTGSTLTITALDNMLKFDKPFSGVSVVFPCTAKNLLNAVCMHCGVLVATTSFTNDDYVIQERPIDDAISCREVISWIAQISGNFARCNTQGALELKWYSLGVFESNNYDGGNFTDYASGDQLDGGSFTDYNSGDSADGGSFSGTKDYHHIYALNNISVATDDVVITGIQVTDTAETPNTVLFGQSGYVISIEGNKLIQSLSDAEIVANIVGAKIVGMRFRPLTATAVSDPSREAGDVAYVTDRKHNTYLAIISNYTFATYQHDKISSDAESPARNSSKQYSEATKAIVEARRAINHKLTTYDLMVQQLNNLVAHSFGVYKTEVTLNDGSTIYYMHDKPTLAESQKIWKQTADAFAVSTDGGQTFTAGFDVEGNAVVNILSAIGINADWVRTGKFISADGSVEIDLTNGTFVLKDNNGQALITSNGVANSDNFSASDNVADTYPLRIPFNIDDNVSQITKVQLNFTVDKFRTYSKGVSSGGSTNTSTGMAGSYLGVTGASTSSISINTGGGTNVTSTENGSVSHSHTLNDSHSHSVSDNSHNHYLDLDNHNHSIAISEHSHTLNYGIIESAVTSNAIDIYIDGVLRKTVNTSQGIEDLTAWITLPGWHTIELRSATLKMISAQIAIKSYIRR